MIKRTVAAALIGAVLMAILPGAAFAAPVDMSGMDHKNMAGCGETCDASLARQKPPEAKHCAICFERQSRHEDKAITFESKKPIKPSAIFEHKNAVRIYRGSGEVGRRPDFKRKPQTDFLKNVRKRE